MKKITRDALIGLGFVRVETDHPDEWVLALRSDRWMPDWAIEAYWDEEDAYYELVLGESHVQSLSIDSLEEMQMLIKILGGGNV